MLFRQQTFVLLTLALLALFASNRETGVMVAAEDKEDKEDKNSKEVETPVEIDVDNTTVDEIMDEVEDELEEMELPTSDDGNFTESALDEEEEEETEDIDCSCDGDVISCSDPGDEAACVCEDGDVVCEDVAAEMSEAPVETPAEAVEEPPVTVMIDEPPAPDIEMVESNARTSPTMVSMAISAAGVAAVALN